MWTINLSTFNLSAVDNDGHSDVKDDNGVLCVRREFDGVLKEKEIHFRQSNWRFVFWIHLWNQVLFQFLDNKIEIHFDSSYLGLLFWTFKTKWRM